MSRIHFLLFLFLAACTAGPSTPADGGQGAIETAVLTPFAAGQGSATAAIATATVLPATVPPATVLPADPPPTAPAANNVAEEAAAAAPPLFTPPLPAEIGRVRLPGKAGALALTPDGALYVVTGRGHEISLYRSDDGGQSFGPPEKASGDIPAYAANIERPSVFAGLDNYVGVSWLQLISHKEAIVWYAASTDGGQRFAPPVQVNGPELDQALLIRGLLDANNNPLLAWLQRGQLRLARGQAAGQRFAAGQLLDDSVCECCQPQLLILGDTLFIVYRNLAEESDGRQIRDIYLTASTDGGATFGQPISVSDRHWYMDACPTAGPSMAVVGESLYVAFIDGRFDDGSRRRTDLFLAQSTDNGQSFGENIRVNINDGAYNGLSSLAAGPDGSLHLSWQANKEGRQLLYYARSEDGHSFSQPWVVAASDDGSNRGRPNNPQIAVGSDGRLYLLWVDELGVHIINW